MRRRTITLMQELPTFLHTCSEEELYQLARALRHELVRRGKPAALVADELAEALLLDARIEHRAIFSADCSGELRDNVAAWRNRTPPQFTADRPAE